MLYIYDKSFQFGPFEVKIDTMNKYGYFEHDQLGDERGGGLWFEVSDQSTQCDGERKLKLIDYDGVAVLPKFIVNGLRENGFIVEPEFD